jgi:hypothetical protein
VCDGVGDAGVVCAGWTAGVVWAGCTAGVVCVWTAGVVCVVDDDEVDELVDVDELLAFAGGFGALFRFGSAGAAPTAVTATFC